MQFVLFFIVMLASPCLSFAQCPTDLCNEFSSAIVPRRCEIRMGSEKEMSNTRTCVTQYVECLKRMKSCLIELHSECKREIEAGGGSGTCECSRAMRDAVDTNRRNSMLGLYDEPLRSIRARNSMVAVDRCLSWYTSTVNGKLQQINSEIDATIQEFNDAYDNAQLVKPPAKAKTKRP